MSRLEKIHKGTVEAPWSALLYGARGVGKTTFGTSCPGAIVLAAEPGAEEIDCHSYKPENWTDALGFFDDLNTSKYETLVVDSVDWLHDMLEEHVCTKHKWDNIEAPGYGKGFKALVPPWREMLAKLELLRKKMNILFVGHATIKRFNNPDGEDFDRIVLKIYDGNAALVQEWVKHVFFAEFETQVMGDKGGKKKGVQTGRRIMHTERRAAFEAKNRWSLPPILPLSYTALVDARAAAAGDLDKELEDRIAAMDPETKKKFDAWFTKQPNRKIAVAQAINQLRSKEAA